MFNFKPVNDEDALPAAPGAQGPGGEPEMVLFHFNLRLDGWTAGDVI